MIARVVEKNWEVKIEYIHVQLKYNNLKENGLLFFEINEYLGKEMIELLKLYEFDLIELKQDIFGKDRMIKAAKKAWKK